MKTKIMLALLLAAATSMAADPVKLPSTAQAGTTIDESLRNEARAAILRGKEWLLKKQQAEGNWSLASYPALTALPLWALVLRGDIVEDRDIEAVEKAKAFLLSKAKADGSIFDAKGGLRNYNTAISMTALHLTGHNDARPVVLKARSYVAKSQHLDDDLYRGGFGYDKDATRLYADGINTTTAIEALAITADVEDFRPAGEEKAKVDKQAAVGFFDRTKNHPKVNAGNPHVSDKPGDRGGHFYKPDDNRAGTFAGKDGTIKFNSYGSMTYAAMLSYIYADVDRDDVRVTSSFEWAKNHWSLDENPGNGQRGYYYFLNVLTKGLNALGEEQFVTPKGAVGWRKAVVQKILSLQKLDDDGSGYWLNPEDKWFERDPVLTSSYMLIALQTALGE